MILPDVNILVYAHIEYMPDHQRYRAWLEAIVSGDQPYGMADTVLSGFLRIVTNPRIFDPPSAMESALAFVDRVRYAPSCVVIAPSARHWEIFTRLCQLDGMRGNLVSDAYLAALAIESDSEWITMDRDFARFPGLRWRRPFD